ncbi:MAG: hypothetical protein OXC63_02090 [Aestuariivita sp.]|nr:hypothetical protein [Aestuariivita sp.]MCY4347607.1 hypothetical protein [Aestuariivita sp.]
MTMMPQETDLCHSKTPPGVDLSPEQRLAAVGHKLVAFTEDLGLSKDVADWFRKNPLAAEHAFRDLLFGVARSVLKPAFAALDDHEPTLTVADHRITKLL